MSTKKNRASCKRVRPVPATTFGEAYKEFSECRKIAKECGLELEVDDECWMRVYRGKDGLFASLKTDSLLAFMYGYEAAKKG